MPLYFTSVSSTTIYPSMQRPSLHAYNSLFFIQPVYHFLFCKSTMTLLISVIWPFLYPYHGPIYSRSLLHDVASVISTEVRSFYNDDRTRGIFTKSGLGCFAPVVNVAHHPLWGRIQVGRGHAGSAATQWFRPTTYDVPMLFSGDLRGGSIPHRRAGSSLRARNSGQNPMSTLTPCQPYPHVNPNPMSTLSRSPLSQLVLRKDPPLS